MSLRSALAVPAVVAPLLLFGTGPPAVAQAPTLTSVEPAHGPAAGSTLVTILGTGFTENAAISVGGALATQVVVHSDTRITARTPPGQPGEADVLVRRADGREAIQRSAFRFEPPPAVLAVFPADGSASGGFTITIVGTGFKQTPEVLLGGVPADEVSYNSSSLITAKTRRNSARVVDVTVINPDQQAGTLSAGFTFHAIPAAGDTCDDPRSSHPADEDLSCWGVRLFGDGAVSGVVSGSDQIAPAAGALGLAIEKRTYSLLALVNVAAGADTVRAQFGETLLPRATGGAFDAALVMVRRPISGRWLPTKVGVYGYATGSKRTWAMSAADTIFDGSEIPPVVESIDTTTSVFDVPMVGFGIGLYREFVNQGIGNTQLSMVIDVGVVHRAIAGQLRDARFDDLRRQVLGGVDTDVFGFEGGIELGVNNLKAEFYYMDFLESSFGFDDPILGVAKGNIVARFSIQGNLFSRHEWVRNR